MSVFPIWIPFFPSSYVITAARTPNAMLNKSGKSEHHCLVPDLKEMLSAFHTEYNVNCGSMVFIMLRYVPPVPTLLKAFIISGRWILSKKLFLHLLRLPYDFIHLVMWCITLFELQILNYPSIPGVNFTWWWYMIFFMHCWIWLANILFSVFHLFAF